MSLISMNSGGAVVTRRRSSIVVHLLNHEGVDHDVSNLICRNHTYSYIFTPCDYDSDSDCGSCCHDDELDSSRAAKEELSKALYPNLQDPCNKRLVQEVRDSELQWDIVRPATSTAASRSNNNNDKEEEYFARFERAEQTALPRRAQTAPLHQFHPMSPVATIGGGGSGSGSLISTTSTTTAASSSSLIGSASPYAASSSSWNTTNAPNSAPAAGNWQQRRSRRMQRSSFTPRTNTVHRRVPPRRNMSFNTPPQLSSSSSYHHQSMNNNNNCASPSIELHSSNSGLRPRVNYKSLYGSSSSNTSVAPTLQTSMSSSSLNNSCSSLGNSSSSHHTERHMGRWVSSSPQDDQQHREASLISELGNDDPHWPLALEEGEEVLEEEDDDDGDEPVPQDEQHEPIVQTMEIAPNVRVPVLSRQESWAAVHNGDYTVATCFACANQLVCSRTAAFVLCPDCQVVSPLNISTTTTTAMPKKDENPVGVGTGLKREWISDMVR